MSKMFVRVLVGFFLFALAPAGARDVFAGRPVSDDHLTGFTLEPNRARLTLRAGTYRISESGDTHRIVMDGYRDLSAPGEPRLLMRRLLIALPPGARAVSVELLGASTTTLDGAFRIEPCPAVLPLSDSPGFDEGARMMRREWQETRDEAYSTDGPHPAQIAWLHGAGTLRKYAYASVVFSPFTYHPVSGRLEYHDEVEIAIRYVMTEPEEAGSARAQALLRDRSADGKAAELFANYEEIASLYRPIDVSPPARLAAYDYVIITTTSLESAIASSGFEAWKTSLGHSVRIVRTSDSEITTQPGIDLAERIRNFLRSYYGTWGIEYVLLVGDYATVPMRICYPNPNFHVYNPNNPGLIGPGTPTDSYYADLSFPDAVSWDSDGDGFPGEFGDDAPDFLAEVSVGRIPVNDATRITYALDKLVAFEQSTGAWKNDAILAGSILFFENQDFGGGPFLDGATLLDSLDRALLGGWSVTRFSEQAGIVTSLFPWPAIKQSTFATAWRTGEHAVVIWSGHGWCETAARTVWDWDDGDGVPETDGSDGMSSRRFIEAGTTNLDDDHPSIVFAISCNVGYPEPNAYGNLGIDLLTLPGWGSSAGIVCSSRPAAVSHDWMGDPGGTESICYEFYRYLLADEERVGDAFYDGKFHANTTYGWDMYYEYMNMYNFNLYGDPALALGSVSTGVAVGPDPGASLSVRLGRSRPNPFVTSTTLRFTTARRVPIRVSVYDVRGRKISGLLDAVVGPGDHAVMWSGTDDRGQPVAPGLFFLAVRAGGEEAIRKIVRLR